MHCLSNQLWEAGKRTGIGPSVAVGEVASEKRSERVR